MNQTEFYKRLPRRDLKYPYCPKHPEAKTQGMWTAFYNEHRDCLASPPADPKCERCGHEKYKHYDDSPKCGQVGCPCESYRPPTTEPAEGKCECGHRWSNHAKNAFNGLTCTKCGCADAPPLSTAPPASPKCERCDGFGDIPANDDDGIPSHVCPDCHGKGYRPSATTEPAERIRPFDPVQYEIDKNAMIEEWNRPTASPAETTEHAKAFYWQFVEENGGDMKLFPAMQAYAEQYATKQIERQTPAIIERFVEEVSKEADRLRQAARYSESFVGAFYPAATQRVKARREGGEK